MFSKLHFFRLFGYHHNTGYFRYKVKYHMITKRYLFTFPERGIDLDQRRYDETGDRRDEDPEEEARIAQLLLDPAARHRRDHHSEGHDPRRDRIADRLVLPLADHDHEERIGREAETVAELFHCNGRVDQPEALLHRPRQPDEDCIRQDAEKRALSRYEGKRSDDFDPVIFATTSSGRGTF